VLEADDSPMTVKTALQLINAELDEYLGGIQGEFDADTRFAITWFEQNGMGKGDYGVADNLARARGIAVESVKHAGIVESSSRQGAHPEARRAGPRLGPADGRPSDGLGMPPAPRAPA
jgi:hypothetical protein